ncbi:formate--tetrahydrofolate ligase [Meiothermus hypogaeus]|uniref:Formate--tetrahydrofolate ligase n=2 Tax=Meiothermus hypogaeus TaxID=884155 RepID=A0A511R2G2_9DEIN|nr:formate--tetrahydrofolate ligase [Meiothermus hypogaeus]RIH80009.1 Formate--tetrahydrofolate ligase [Meiothermus hypogaeus]GEM83769.1 formate--tetrahydrofolate ligase [Meiothermus hypogaeus NBRC 106114]GIW35894.1 MAG: formate--tetrahydrofolate ligase [Meiothermus sp.]
MDTAQTHVPSDLEIARQAKPKPIEEVATSLGIPAQALFHYGPHMAKVLATPPAPRGKLILVTAMTPTPAGEGKTTVAIGLTEALGKLGKKVAVALREPSLGPVFGIKGGATGGGYAQVLPMEEINLHFTGDFHAITSAVNLLSAMVDNHLHQGNALGLDVRRIEVKRALDMNDRALRQVIVGLGGPGQGVPREAGFEITVASEVMAIMSLADSLSDLQERLGRIRVGYNQAGQPVYARDLGAEGAMTVLLKQAFYPNLVQTLEHQPAFVHMGPFGNIAHGTNSVVATRMALGYADYVVTEAGFGSDLGAEKYINLVCRRAGFAPQAVVLVATMRALRFHGGQDEYTQPNPEAVRQGLPNLAKHIENVRLWGYPPVLAFNRFPSDTPQELELVRAFAEEQGVRVSFSEVHARGGAGGTELAQMVLEALENPGQPRFTYGLEQPLEEKIARIAQQVYGAAKVEYTQEARKALKRLEKEGCSQMPVIIAKAAASLSDNPRLRGRPEGFSVTVTDLKPKCGAGFVVAYMGEIMTMPGLPKEPAAIRIGLDEEGQIRGLF